MSVNVNNTPWECDDIVFLPGDWVIARASEEGRYQYSVSGITSRYLATAADLVKWKMAKIIPLDLLLPWDNDGITFNGGVDILRDFLHSSGKEKYYLLHDADSATMLLRVNKYYLLKEKYAVASDELKQAINKKKVKSKKYNRSCEPWPGDDIFILDTEDEITRGSTPGQYRVRTGFTSRNWRAAILVSEGKAITGYDARLEELASCESAPLQEYFQATRNFWRTAAGSIPTFSEIAHIWCSLQYNHTGSITSALVAELDSAIAFCKTFNEKFADFNDKANAVDDLIKVAQPQIKELENTYNICTAFKSRTILDDFTSFSQFVQSYNIIRNEVDTVYRDISVGLAEIDTILSSIKQDVAQIESVKFFPHDVLPRECVAYMKSKENEYTSLMGKLQDFSPYELRLADLRATVELIKSELEQMDIATVKSAVERTVARKSDLDLLREEMRREGKFNKKPGLFARANKEDGIKYTTGIQIKSKSRGKYVVTYSKGSVELSVLELIYLGLAKRT